MQDKSKVKTSKSTTKARPAPARDGSQSASNSDFVKPGTIGAKAPWWEAGVRFQCQGSGKCCTSHGEFGYVFLTLADRKRMAAHLELSTAEFTREYCAKLRGAFHLKEDLKQPDCLFLKGKSCGIYEARPTQCRTWPFWPEVMEAKTWKKEVVAFCPGVGKGPLRTADEIREQMELQEKAEWELR